MSSAKNVNFYLRKRYSMIAQLLGSIRLEFLVDLGCGDGSASAYYSRRNDVHVVGLDIRKHLDWSMIESVDFIIADVNYLPFRPRSIDVITMTELLEHLNNDVTFLKNAKNILKNGGYILLSTPNGARVTTFLSRLRIKMRNWRRNLTPMDHRREYAPWELRKTLSKTGFLTMIHAYVYFCPYIPMPLKWLTILDRAASNFQLSSFLKWGSIMVARVFD